MISQRSLFAPSLFEAYHSENPQVWELFERFALEAARAGRRRFGAKMIFERMRWYTQVETRSDDLKLNNNYTAHYARMFMDRHPEYEGLFEVRAIRNPR